MFLSLYQQVSGTTSREIKHRGHSRWFPQYFYTLTYKMQLF